MTSIVIREKAATLKLGPVTVAAERRFLPEISEALTIPIDEKATSPRVLGDTAFPVGTKFRAQADVDRALSGASEFKHWMDVLDALADLETFFPITLTLAGNSDQFGRAGDTITAFDFSRTVFKGANAIWDIQGPNPSTWAVFGGFSTQAITVVQAGSNDPFVDTSGTPYTTGALKGLRVRFTTGQIVEIHDNTTSRIHFVQELSPVPLLTDTFDVIRPPRLRNTTDGTTLLVPNGIGAIPFRWSTNRGVEARTPNNVSNIGFDALAKDIIHHRVTGPDFWLWDRVEFSRDLGGSGFTFRAFGNAKNIFVNTTHRGAASEQFFDIAPDSSGSNAVFQDCYLQVGANPILGLFAGVCNLVQTVLEGGGSNLNQPPSSVYVDRAVTVMSLFSFSNGKRTTFRAPVAVPALVLDGAVLSTNLVGGVFENCPSACIRMINGARYDESGQTLSPGLIDGGGNSDVGFELDSRSTLVHQNAGGTTLSGALGDVRVVGSAPTTYAALNASPVADLTNFVLASSP